MPHQESAAYAYISAIEANLRRGNATEHTHRPALKALLEALDQGVSATNEPTQRTDCGAPDMVITKRPGPLEIGWVECKDVGESLAKALRSNQLKRYLKALPNLILTDYIDFKWYVNGDEWGAASLGTVNEATGRINTSDQRKAEVVELLGNFLAQSPAPISRPRDLAQRMASLAHMIRHIIIEAFANNQASDTITDLRRAMAQVLIPDLEEDAKTKEFADIYAQTLTYGLFAARCNHPFNAGQFTRASAAREIPRTNPFLRRLFETITGAQLDDEPYASMVDSLVNLLAHANMLEVLKNFGTETAQKDPVLHFYETFLAAYDPALRESRGVYYTPTPVVQYIVRSVDHLLKTRFGIADGLADRQKIETDDGECHRTLILDPACGTGTFLYETIGHIRETFRGNNRAGMWSGYVKDHLLPRIHGFELLMAPYAIAHFKLGMQLAGQDLPEVVRPNWAYDFATDERLRVYLTNTLESVERHVQQLLGPFRIISEEAEAAQHVKRDLPILVVTGNPPYSGESANQGRWIKDLLKGVSPSGPTSSYFHVDGEPLGERNSKWLHDDYVKFIRWAQWRIETTGHGVLAFITNHGYLDNPTFRGMRWSLLHTFDELYLLDLHGNTNKKEVAPDGSADRNVFDIKDAGVCIAVLVKRERNASTDAQGVVRHAELWGSREAKYDWLSGNSIATTDWHEVDSRQPLFLFKRLTSYGIGDYEDWSSIRDIMPLNSVGIVTGRDGLTVHPSPESVWQTVTRFLALPPEDARRDFELREDTRDWKVRLAQADLDRTGPSRDHVLTIAYRPFDIRFTYYTDRSKGFLCMPRGEVMNHMHAGANRAILTARSNKFPIPNHFFCSDTLSEAKCSEASTQSYLFPLYTYPNVGRVDQHTFDQWPEGQNGRRPNLDPDFVNQLAESIGLNFVTDGRGDLEATFGPEDVLHYIYAIFHCPTYRERYAEFLKLDFPRVPVASDNDLFVTLCKLGRRVMALHLLEDPDLSGNSIAYPVRGDNIIAKGYPKYVPPGAEVVRAGRDRLQPHDDRGRVYISPDQFFEGIEPEVWEFQIGGYQVAEKWLKDRRERELSHDDITHYTRTIEALRGTIALMTEIDEAIDQHDGWPDAFVTSGSGPEQLDPNDNDC